jgi:hypothetical protein
MKQRCKSCKTRWVAEEITVCPTCGNPNEYSLRGREKRLEKYRELVQKVLYMKDKLGMSFGTIGKEVGKKRQHVHEIYKANH